MQPCLFAVSCAAMFVCCLLCSPACLLFTMQPCLFAVYQGRAVHETMLAPDMIKACATDITDTKYNQLDIVTEVDLLLFQPHNRTL